MQHPLCTECRLSLSGAEGAGISGNFLQEALDRWEKIVYDQSILIRILNNEQGRCIPMDLKAMFKLSYGLFVAGVERAGRQSACIINTVGQVTATPNRVSVTMMKGNHTTQEIVQKGSLAVSVLSQKASLDLVSAFGYRSSREADKFAGVDFRTDGKGNPWLTGGMNAWLGLTVEQTIDLDTHYLFICSVDDGEVLSDDPSMTYGDYRILKSGGALPGQAAQETAPAPAKKKYVCSICHYVYDGEIPFEQLPEDYVCPICKRPKSVFVEE